MLLVMHIGLAVISMGQVVFAMFAPTARKLKVVYGMTIAAVVSGFLVGVEKQMHLGQICLGAMAYVGLIGVGVVVVKRRMASEDVRI